MPPEHTYRTELSWSGWTASGYSDYARTHEIRTPPASEPLRLSADSAFRGDPTLTNPEQLLLAAASSCQLLSFLAVAARAGLEVVGYQDRAEAVMPVTAGPMRIQRILLRPHVVVAAGTDPDAVRRALAEAHRQCYIANTLNAAVVVEPTITSG